MKLLIADDSTTIQKVIQIAFESENAELAMVGSYIELISEANKSKFDAIICDVALAGANGPADFTKVKEINPETPFLMLQGSFEQVSLDEFKAAGFSDFLKKPFDSDAIVSKVKELVGAPAASPAAPASPQVDLFAGDESPGQEAESNEPPAFSLASTPEQKGQKAFEAQESLSLSSVEELNMAGKEETSPALNLELMSVKADKVEEPVVKASQPAPIDLDALSAQVMPALKEQIHSEIKLQLKELVGEKINLVIRDIVKEELRRLVDEKSALHLS